MCREFDPIAFFHSLSRFGVQPGLERINALLEDMRHPEYNGRFVHVAGTNGKGTVCTEIASVLKAAGFQTGLYTSPYVLDFRERIRIDGEMISPTALRSASSPVCCAVKRLNETGIFPTEFEAVTAAAFNAFAAANCSVTVLETGLGGRFDATNVIRSPIVSVITSVSLDHMQVLGSTLAEIAAEKCGIIKPRCHVVTSAHQPEEVLAVIRRTAAEKGAYLFEADENELFQTVSSDLSGSLIRWRNTDIRVPFAGAHQLQNAALAIKALEVIGVNGLDITVKHIKEGIESAFIPARTEILCPKPLIILDGSHNEGSVSALASLLEAEAGSMKILAVMGMMADKDCPGAAKRLKSLVSHVIAVTPSNPRAMKAGALKAIFENVGVSAEATDDPKAGIDAALAQLPEYDALVVCGSLYLAADVRGYLIEKIREIYQGG